MPLENQDVKFKNYYRKIKTPFVIYGDFEAINIPSNEFRGKGTKVLTKQIMSSYCLYLVSNYPDIIQSQILELYRGEDCGYRFAYRINR